MGQIDRHLCPRPLGGALLPRLPRPRRCPLPPPVRRVPPQGPWLVASLAIRPRTDGVSPLSLLLPYGSRLVALRATLYPVVITGGTAVHRLPYAWSVPRKALLENLRALFEIRRLRLPPNLPLAEALTEELLSLPSRAKHDDLAFALALAAWPARR